MNKTLQVKEILNKYISRQRAIKQFRLPSERTLAEQLGYSRATIGKALGVLEGEGIILRKRGAGAFLVDIDKKHTMTIAIALRNAYNFSDLHFRMIIEEVTKKANENNIRIKIYDHLSTSFKKEPNKNPLILAIRSGDIDGVLIGSRMPISIISKISDICPTVLINNIFGDGSDVPCISCDYFQVGYVAGKYLFENGHHKVAYVTDRLELPEARFEFSGFKAAFGMVGIDASKHILETRLDLNTFKKQVLDFFAHSDYTACYVRRSDYAAKMISVLENVGIEVPKSLSVIASGSYFNYISNKSKLAIVDNQLAEMCNIGLHTLQNIINNNKIKGGSKLLTPKIIENDSVINLNPK